MSLRDDYGDEIEYQFQARDHYDLLGDRRSTTHADIAGGTVKLMSFMVIMASIAAFTKDEPKQIESQQAVPESYEVVDKYDEPQETPSTFVLDAKAVAVQERGSSVSL